MTTANLVDSVPAAVLHKEITSLGVKHIVIVPDTHQKTLLASLDTDKSLRVLRMATEQEALCVSAGLWMGGAESLVIIQNVGLFASLNALRGVGLDQKVPMCILVGQYGHKVNLPIEEDPGSNVRLIEGVCDAMGVPHYRIDRSDDVGVLSTAFAQSRAERRPTVVLVSAPTA